MKYLLDTYIFFWCLADESLLPSDVREAIAHPSASVYVSSASAFETSAKVRLGKWGEATALASTWVETVRAFGAQSLDISTQHSLLAGSLPWAHRDPFDRLLASQAIPDGLTFVTADGAFVQPPAGLRVLAAV